MLLLCCQQSDGGWISKSLKTGVIFNYFYKLECVLRWWEVDDFALGCGFLQKIKHVNSAVCSRDEGCGTCSKEKWECAEMKCVRSMVSVTCMTDLGGGGTWNVKTELVSRVDHLVDCWFGHIERRGWIKSASVDMWDLTVVIFYFYIFWSQGEDSLHVNVWSVVKCILFNEEMSQSWPCLIFSDTQVLLSELPVTESSLRQCLELTVFSPGCPRLSATVPPCWLEMTQAQQQRRNPQHLQQHHAPTEATRCWSLDSDSRSIHCLGC